MNQILVASTLILLVLLAAWPFLASSSRVRRSPVVRHWRPQVDACRHCGERPRAEYVTNEQRDRGHFVISCCAYHNWDFDDEALVTDWNEAQR